MKASYTKDKICYNAKRYCKDDISLIANYAAMIADTTQRWVCHHRREIDENKSREQLIEENLYYNRPACELIFMTKSDHAALHNKGNTNMLGKHHSEATKQKQSEAHKGNKYGVGNKGPAGKHWTLSEATIQKQNEAKIGRHWFNNGIKNVFTKECPEGFVPGCLRKRNQPDSAESGLPAAE